jgi:hypothetical protein
MRSFWGRTFKNRLSRNWEELIRFRPEPWKSYFTRRTPASWPLRGTAGRGCFFVAIRHGGAPSGVAAFIVPDGERGKNPRIIAEYYDLVWKYNHFFFPYRCVPRKIMVVFVENILKNLNVHGGFTPPRCAPPKMRYHLKRYYIIIALITGAVRGDRNGPSFIFPLLLISLPDKRNSPEQI